MTLYDFNEFLRLSETLSLQLSVRNARWVNIATVILRNRVMAEQDRQVLELMLAYLGDAYGQSRRRLGPLSVLHPLRATALLARAVKKPSLLDLLTCLLHDKQEDLTPGQLGQERWEELERLFSSLLRDTDPEDKWFLMERIEWLSRSQGESYSRYIWRLLDQARRTPELVRVKLADRLDNTLDLHEEFVDPLQGTDFYAAIFRIMFINTVLGERPPAAHPPVSPVSGAQRLYQLFKNIVVMSLISQCRAAVDQPARKLLYALARASSREAERIVMHIFAYHLTDAAKQRELLMNVLDYSQQGCMDRVTLPNEQQRLDGLLLSWFKDAGTEERNRCLADLYQDKETMVRAALAFIVIFQNFIRDPAYFVRGISADGLGPA